MNKEKGAYIRRWGVPKERANGYIEIPNDFIDIRHRLVTDHQWRILEHLARHTYEGKIICHRTQTQIAEGTGLSVWIIRKELEILKKNNLLEITHGIGTKANGYSLEPFARRADELMAQDATKLEMELMETHRAKKIDKLLKQDRKEMEERFKNNQEIFEL